MTGAGVGLVSLDGVNAAALKEAARGITASHRRLSPGVSLWGASGIFDELAVAESDAGVPSARTLVLLYAADLSFRLRWEIQPALDEGRLVVAVPYVTTAIAFGQAAGLEAPWLSALFEFAPTPAEVHAIETAPAHHVTDRKGFVEFAWQRLEARAGEVTRLEFMDRTRRHLRAATRRASGRDTNRPPRLPRRSSRPLR